MNSLSRALKTRGGDVRFPAYLPVTTFGDRYPLDDLIRPYLPRLASAIMVSFHYARQMSDPPRLPLFVDSGGFASLFEKASICASGELGVLELQQEDGVERLHPADVLELQERIADVAFTLDFPIPPGMEEKEARRRQAFTIQNAHWALQNRRRQDLRLYACVQAWDVPSARECARSYARSSFDGIAIGGLVPRARDQRLVCDIVRAVREEIGDTLPLHVFGLGKPDLLPLLIEAGADSVDSSSYVQLAAEGRLWSDPGHVIMDPTPMDRLHLALCNLASATGRTLPLSVAPLVFKTHMNNIPL